MAEGEESPEGRKLGEGGVSRVKLSEGESGRVKLPEGGPGRVKLGEGRPGRVKLREGAPGNVRGRWELKQLGRNCRGRVEAGWQLRGSFPEGALTVSGLLKSLPV